MTDRSIPVTYETHRLLSVFRARLSAKQEKELTWDEFFEIQVQGIRRRREGASWCYTIAVYIGVTVLLLWPVYAFKPILIPVVLVLGAMIAVFSTYALAPFAARKMKIFEDAPAPISESLKAIAATSGLDRCPVLRVAETAEINAYAYSSLTGGGVCLTRGLMAAHETGRLTTEELRAIVGHEIGHLVHNDTLRSNLALSWVSAFDYAGNECIRFGARMAGWGVTLGEVAEASHSGQEVKASGIISLMLAAYGWFSYISGTLLKVLAKLASTLGFHLGRIREYAADDTSAELVNGASMASALETIRKLNEELVAAELAKLPSADRWQVQPRSLTWIDRLWDTHPPTDERIARQRAFAELLPGESARGVGSVSEGC